MKGVEPIVAAVLVIAISLAGIMIVLQYSQPSVSRLSDISLFNQGKEIIKQIDDNFGYVIQEGEGSTRALHLSIGGGQYLVDNSSDSIIFSMDDPSGIVGNGVSRMEGNINITGIGGKITIVRAYPTVNIIGGGSFGAGSRNIVIRNGGYDAATSRQRIAVNVQ
jgi:hypothetical protein